MPDAFAPSRRARRRPGGRHSAQATAGAARKAELAQESQLEAAKAKVDARSARRTSGQGQRRSSTAAGLVIRLVTDQVLFDLGCYELRPQAEPLLAHDRAGDPDAAERHHVEGYTDALPCSAPSATTASPSTGRQSVLDFMGSAGFTIGDRHDALAIPYGARDPLAAERLRASQPAEPPRRDRDPAPDSFSDLDDGAARRPRRRRSP